MAGHGSKLSLKQKSQKAKGKSSEVKAPLTLASKEKPITPIDEIRRQGLVLAWQGIGEATRQRTVGLATPAKLPARSTATVRPASVRPAVIRPPVAVKPGAKRAAVAR